MLTLFVCLTLLCVVALLTSIYLLPSVRGYPGAGYWFGTLVSLACGSLLMAARGLVPAFLSVEFANVLLIFSPALMACSLHKIRGASKHTHVELWLAFVGSVVFVLVAQVRPLSDRIFVFACSTATILGYAAISLRRSGSGSSNWFFVTIFGGMALLSGARALNAYLTQPTGEILKLTGFEPIYVLSAVALTFAYFAAYIVELFHELSRKLSAETDRLAKSNEIKMALFRVIGHDLRGPVGTIAQLLEIADDHLKQTPDLHQRLQPDFHKAFALAWTQSEKTRALLDDLLVYGRAQIQGETGEREWVLVGKAFSEVVQLLSVPAQQKSIELQILPGSERLSVHCEKAGLAIVLRNLVSNAIKFCRPGGKVRLEGLSTAEQVVILVSDNGPGFSEQTMANFNGGGALPTTWGTAGEKGTGLGLEICRSWVRASGGQLTLRGAPGGGATARIALPVSGRALSGANKEVDVQESAPLQ